MGRPVIGLTTYAEETRFGLQDTFAAVLPLAYVHAVHASGGRAVLITPDHPDTDILERVDGATLSARASGGRAVLITPDDPDTDILERIDGIIFAGGSDVDPALYGQAPHPTTN